MHACTLRTHTHVHKRHIRVLIRHASRRGGGNHWTKDVSSQSSTRHTRSANRKPFSRLFIYCDSCLYTNLTYRYTILWTYLCTMDVKEIADDPNYRCVNTLSTQPWRTLYDDFRYIIFSLASHTHSDTHTRTHLWTYIVAQPWTPILLCVYTYRYICNRNINIIHMRVHRIKYVA